MLLLIFLGVVILMFVTAMVAGKHLGRVSEQQISLPFGGLPDASHAPYPWDDDEDEEEEEEDDYPFLPDDDEEEV